MGNSCVRGRAVKCFNTITGDIECMYSNRSLEYRIYVNNLERGFVEQLADPAI